MRTLFIVGSQGIPANYGGLETFAEEVATRLQAGGWRVVVTCEAAAGDKRGPAEYKGVELLYVDAPQNNLRTFVADRRALRLCADHARAGDVVYLLGYGGGPFLRRAIHALRAKGIEFWLNPDGLEWRRPRWSWAVRQYLRFSESLLLRKADRIICDAAAIRDHHRCTYAIPEDCMEVIEYGAPVIATCSESARATYQAFLDRYDLEEGAYYTYVGRFVPDNNMELMVRGVLESDVRRRLVVLAAHDPADAFYLRLHAMIEQSEDPRRVILTGGVYDRPLLQAIRLGAFAYFHGHEVGGTNPALVEAMGLGSLIIALDTPFNREVLGDAGMFFTKSVMAFKNALLAVHAATEGDLERRRAGAVARVREYYNWERISQKYAELLELPLRAQALDSAIGSRTAKAENALSTNAQGIGQ